MIRALGVANLFPGAAQRLKMDPIEAASPVTRVVTGDEIILIWSQIASPESTDPPGELITNKIGFPGSLNSRYQSLRMISLALSESTASERNILRCLKSSSSI